MWNKLKSILLHVKKDCISKLHVKALIATSRSRKECEENPYNYLVGRSNDTAFLMLKEIGQYTIVF